MLSSLASKCHNFFVYKKFELLAFLHTSGTLIAHNIEHHMRINVPIEALEQLDRDRRNSPDGSERLAQSGCASACSMRVILAELPHR